MFFRLALIMMLAVFVGAGYQKLQQPNDTAKYLQTLPNLKFLLKEAKLDKQIKPEHYLHLAMAAGVAETLLPALIFVGLMRRFAAFLLAGFTIIATVLVHVTLPDVVKTPQDQIIQTLKNAAIIGGLLLIVFAPRAAKKEKRD